MRGISREVLARDLAARLVRANCRGQGGLWTDTERQWLEASSRKVAARVAAPALELCSDCPVLEMCARWAATDRYTGLAAGTMWRHGRSREVQRTRTDLPLAS